MSGDIGLSGVRKGGGGGAAVASGTQVSGLAVGPDTYIVSAPAGSVPVTAYVDGGEYIINPDTDNTGASTLNISSVSATDMVRFDTTPVVAGDIPADKPLIWIYDLVEDYFIAPSPLRSERLIAQSGFLEAPADKTYILDESASRDYEIQTFTAKTVSGTATAAIEINGTPVTGISAQAITSVQSTGTSTGLNSVIVGDRVSLTLSAGASPVDCRIVSI